MTIELRANVANSLGATLPGELQRGKPLLPAARWHPRHDAGMTSKNRRILVHGGRREQLNLRALADLIVAAAEAEPRDDNAKGSIPTSMRRLPENP